MTDLILYFALCFLAAIVVCAALARLTRPKGKVVEKPGDALETTKSSFALEDEGGKVVYRFPSNTKYSVQFTTRIPDMPTEPTVELSADWDMELQKWVIEGEAINEDTRIPESHEDDFMAEDEPDLDDGFEDVLRRIVQSDEYAEHRARALEEANQHIAEMERRNANSDKWLNQALEDAGEDYEL